MNPSEENRTMNNLSSLRGDVTETTNILKVTVDKLIQRGEQLDTMNAQAEQLNTSSYQFQGSARRLNRRMREQHYKFTIFIGKVFQFLFFTFHMTN